MSTFAATSLFSETKRAIILLLYGLPQKELYLRQIAKITGLAVGNIQRELAKLVAEGVLTRHKKGRYVYFQANQDCPIFDELRGIAGKTVGVKRPAKRKVIVKKVKREDDDSGYMEGSIADRISSVREITQSVWAFMKDGNAGQRLQRDVAVLTRPKR